MGIGTEGCGWRAGHSSPTSALNTGVPGWSYPHTVSVDPCDNRTSTSWHSFVCAYNLTLGTGRNLLIDAVLVTCVHVLTQTKIALREQDLRELIQGLVLRNRGGGRKDIPMKPLIPLTRTCVLLLKPVAMLRRSMVHSLISLDSRMLLVFLLSYREPLRDALHDRLANGSLSLFGEWTEWSIRILLDGGWNYNIYLTKTIANYSNSFFS